MKDEDLADELIARLNELIKNPVVNEAVKTLLMTRIDVGTTLDTHPTIQVGKDGLGFLGMLNGLVGVIPEDSTRHAGCGYITAVMSPDFTRIFEFTRTRTDSSEIEGVVDRT